jgi:hypothetical protein
VHAAASPVFTELIAAADVLIGETLIAAGLGGQLALITRWASIYRADQPDVRRRHWLQQER